MSYPFEHLSKNFSLGGRQLSVLARCKGIVTALRLSGSALFKPKAAPTPEPLLFETLEPRVLLSAGLSFASAGAGAHDLTLHFDPSSQSFQLLNPANNNAVVQSVASPTDGTLNIQANAG